MSTTGAVQLQPGAVQQPGDLAERRCRFGDAAAVLVAGQVAGNDLDAVGGERRQSFRVEVRADNHGSAFGKVLRGGAADPRRRAAHHHYSCKLDHGSPVSSIRGSR
jgi:hypothetical protein